MIRALLIWLGTTALGVALVALLPETLFGGDVLFRLSDRHGPSIADGLGLALALAGWAFYVRTLWTRRHALRPPWLALALCFVAVLTCAACIASAAADQDALALIFGATSFAAQLGLAFTAPREA